MECQGENVNVYSTKSLSLLERLVIQGFLFLLSLVTVMVLPAFIFTALGFVSI